jgi:hypothetical protein
MPLSANDTGARVVTAHGLLSRHAHAGGWGGRRCGSYAATTSTTTLATTPDRCRDASDGILMCFNPRQAPDASTASQAAKAMQLTNVHTSVSGTDVQPLISAAPTEDRCARLAA